MLQTLREMFLVIRNETLLYIDRKWITLLLKDSKWLQTCLGVEMNVMHARNEVDVRKKPVLDVLYSKFGLSLIFTAVKK